MYNALSTLVKVAESKTDEFIHTCAHNRIQGYPFSLLSIYIHKYTRTYVYMYIFTVPRKKVGTF